MKMATEDEIEAAQQSLSATVDGFMDSIRGPIDVMVDAAIVGFIATYEVDPETAVKELRSIFKDMMAAAIVVSIASTV